MALSLKPVTSIQDDLFDSLLIVRRIVSGFSRTYESIGIGGVFAGQGCGRSSIIALCDEFASKNPLQIDHKITCWIKPFQSWKMVAIASPLNSLLWHIQKNLPENVSSDEKILYKLGRISVAISALESAYETTSSGNNELSRNSELINNTLPPERKSQVSSAFSACEHIEELSESFTTLGKMICERCGFDKIVIPIDDLDKCTPRKAIHLLTMIFTIVKCRYFSFLIAADREILSRFLNSSFDNILTSEQADDLLMTYFDDWVNLPSPPLRNVLKKIDLPVSIKDVFYEQAEIAGLTAFATSLTSIHRACRRFEAFIYGESVKSTNTLGDYIAWLGWFLVGTDDKYSLEKIIKSNNMEGMLKIIREPSPSLVAEKKVIPPFLENSNRIRIDAKGSEKIKSNQLKQDLETGEASPIRSFLVCMNRILSDSDLVLRLKEVVPYL